MQTSQYATLGQIITSVYQDFKGFLDFTPENQPVQKACKELRKELKRKNPILYKSGTLSQFTEQYLAWVETEERNPSEDNFGPLFLKALRSWLRLFSLSGLQEFNMLIRAPKAQSLGRYVASFSAIPSESYRLTPTIIKQDYQREYNLMGFPSWLIIHLGQRELFILCDDQRICERITTREAERRYEYITLHEIGHTRLHLKWLRNEVRKGNNQVSAKPCHEFEAWVYAYTMLGLIAGMRARIGRLLGDPDTVGLG